MEWKREWKPLAVIAAAFAVLYWLPVGTPRFDDAMLEGLHLARWYAREHVLLCLVPAFFIAGAIAVFVSQASVMRYLGPQAHKGLAYGVASVSGTVLAVCSCTVLPLFAGIYRMGAGLGPATAFLYSGPAINVLAIILTARILGLELGIARAVGAIGLSVIIGLAMHFLFRREELNRAAATPAPAPEDDARPLGQNALYFAAMVAILVFANWGRPESDSGLWHAVYTYKWWITAAAAAALAAILVAWLRIPAWKMAALAALTALAALAFPKYPVLPFAVGALGLATITATGRGESRDWFDASWGFAKQILPLLLAGVLVSGVLLGRPDHEGLIPSVWVARLVGGNGVGANLFAALSGALMYFATLTEVPILQGLIGSGMGQGPALALLLSGPSLSLPSMLVIYSLVGLRKTAAYAMLVVVLSAAAGFIYGNLCV